MKYTTPYSRGATNGIWSCPASTAKRGNETGPEVVTGLFVRRTYVEGDCWPLRWAEVFTHAWPAATATAPARIIATRR